MTHVRMQDYTGVIKNILQQMAELAGLMNKRWNGRLEK